ncbi:flagellar hook-length control protein FliK [Pusillimonas sp. SM2304]|uniref:flagellar hook-length control protein FliK n=1 Tax=Pusillimonas sp. SM2304 TaxID=3073241 RepID=UPI002875D8FD|nr:flagellar hook-length control protein FliK [Pusillimonas sp. SM2304]MDS1141144.1 flagellar hook-length control protein FliK [Pusillimonas sp. SM2304]
MSVGPPALGTLLVQRLDAVLGTTLSAQANIVSGARPDAVSQPGNPERPDAARNETQRHPRETVDRITAQTEQQNRHAVDRARLDARTAAALLARNAPNTAATPSAPTTLGQAAKTILALLANYPEQSAAVMGKRPLLDRHPNGQAQARTGTGPNAATAGAQTTAGSAGARAAGPAAGGPASLNPGAAAPAGSGGSAAAGVTAGAGLAATGAPPMAMQLAQALSQALQGSGMFYESHLNHLAFGKHSLASLQQEPQAQVGRQAANPANNTAGDAAAPRAGAELTASSSTGARGAETTHPAGTTQTAATPSPSAPPVPGLDPQTHVLVRQQLEVLANQTFAWRGEAWPEAPMEWEVTRHEAALGTDVADHWATRINVHLPTLGHVQARLTLSGQQLVMHLIAPDAADLLDQHAEALRGRYSAQGLQLSQLSIAPEDAPEPAPEPIAADPGDQAGTP